MCVCVCVCVCLGAAPFVSASLCYAGFMETRAQRDCSSEEQLYRDQTPSGGYISPPAERQPQCDPPARRVPSLQGVQRRWHNKGLHPFKIASSSGRECVCVCACACVCVCVRVFLFDVDQLMGRMGR